MTVTIRDEATATALAETVGGLVELYGPDGRLLGRFTPAPRPGMTFPELGMTDDELAVALKLFGQVDGSKTRSYEGTGLGLPIAKALIELHGGRLEIRTAKGQGTVVAVQLPSKNHVSTAD